MSGLAMLEDIQMEATLLNDVPIPGWLDKRKRDTLNLPIPSVCFMDPDVGLAKTAGTPYSEVDFDAINWNAWASIAQDKRCGYCAHPLSYWMMFLGHQHEVYAGVFLNLPMHPECVHYLCQVYPTVYLPRMRDRRRSEGGQLPTRLGIYKTRDYKVIRPPGPETTKLNYAIRAGTKKDTMWVEYPREMMAEHAARERHRYGIVL